MNNFLVLGGTGFVGRSVCDRLVARSGGAGGRIVVPSRRPQRAKHLQLLPTVELVEADIHDPAQLTRLVAGCDAVVNLVAILHGSQAAFERTHVVLARTLAGACRAGGVSRLVHVSALGVGSGGRSLYLKSKLAGEAALRGADLALTILRPSVIFGEHDRFLNLFAGLQSVFPLVPLAAAEARFQPVWVQDVAEAIVHCLDTPSTIGQVYECAGPDVYTLAELVRLAGRWSGHRRPVFGLPAGLGRLQAGVMQLLPGEPLMSADNLESMKTPNVATRTLPGFTELGITPAALSSVAPGYLGREQGPSRFNRWRRTAERR